jgi:Fe-S cluster assembly protein SufD
MQETLTENNLTAIIAQYTESQFSPSDAVLTFRQEALEKFKRLGIPQPKNEEYKYTPLSRILEKNFDFTKPNAEATIGDISNLLLHAEANVLVFINGRFSKKHSAIISPESEITITTLSEAVKTKTSSVVKSFGKNILLPNDSLVALNSAAWQDGVFIEVGNKSIVQKPVFIYHIHDAQHGQVISHTRNLISIGSQSKLTVLEKFDSIGNANHFSTLLTEVVVSDRASFNLYSIQNDGGNRYQHNNVFISQADSSRVNTHTYSLNGKLIRNNLNIELDGEGIESHMYGLYLLKGDTLADNHTVVDHKKANSFSNELYKGVMDDTAKGVFNGKIYVRPQAQKTNAFQANRNILLTDKATVNTKPQLEIWADDVKCSHGCTTGQLDEEALFYLQARGISKETARAMMLYAFAGELIEKISDPVIREYIDTLVGERLH